MLPLLLSRVVVIEEDQPLMLQGITIMRGSLSPYIPSELMLQYIRKVYYLLGEINNSHHKTLTGGVLTYLPSHQYMLHGMPHSSRQMCFFRSLIEVTKKGFGLSYQKRDYLVIKAEKSHLSTSNQSDILKTNSIFTLFENKCNLPILEEK